MELYKELYFNELGDERGHLVVAEFPHNIPFVIKRIFYIYGSDKNVVRGKHANRRSEFVLINVSGSCKVKIDTGKDQKIVNLDKPHKGLYLNKMVWKYMYDFSDDSVLLVLSNIAYDPNEYIRDYNEYLKEMRDKG